MTHRIGHVEESGEGQYSMDRRKYLSTLAAGAAFGTVAVGLAACGTGSDKGTTTDTTTQGFTEKISGGPCEVVTGQNLWGYLRMYPPEVLRVGDAVPADHMGKPLIRIPFFNNTGIDLSVPGAIGFHVLKIGCPTQFVLAINLTKEDHPPEGDDQVWIRRNTLMDQELEKLRYERLAWNGPDTEDCPPK